MKKHLVITISLFLITCSSFSQTFEMRTFLNEYDYISVQLRQTNLGVQPNPLSNTDNDGINDLGFTLRWLQSLGDVDVDMICSTYNIIESGTRQTNGTYYYQQFGASLAFYSPDNYVLNEWITIATIQTSIASGTNNGSFELAPNGWAGNLIVTIDWNDAGSSTEYYPSLITGNCDNTPIPTIVYDYVWVGGTVTPPFYDANSWGNPANWKDECGGSNGTAPTAANNVYIPGNLAEYPTNMFTPSASFAGTGLALNVTVETGGNITFGNTSHVDALDFSGNLSVYGSVTIAPDGQVTVDGDTYLDAAECLIVQATTDGVGSFIDNGTITYGTGGTAKVQTYLSNSAGSGNFDIHLVGPTVDEANYTGGGTGAFLSAFAIDESTYAYEYNDGWQNINSNTFEVRTANGIGLSTIDNTNHTLEMTGALMTGNQSSPTLAFVLDGNNYELISNPYPSSIDFDALAATNSGVVDNKYWIWNPASNGYIARAAEVGGLQYIQVGQGFFVETNSGGTFDFTNTERTHSNNAFRETMPNILTITAEGGMEGYKDVSIIRFTEEATFGYDKNIEAKYWESQNSDATSLRSVTEDNLELAINVLPTESLSGEMLSIPLKFDCGYSNEYTLSFTDIETFEMGTEIYLEDLNTGDDWIYLNDNPIYTFNATSYQSSDRFIVHFFGPTGMEEISEENIDIYSSGQYAYVRNNTDENIKMIYVYNLSGELIMSTKSDNQKVSKLLVSDKIGYYVVRVITDTNSYTKKVLIFN